MQDASRQAASKLQPPSHILLKCLLCFALFVHGSCDFAARRITLPAGFTSRCRLSTGSITFTSGSRPDRIRLSANAITSCGNR